MTVGYAAEGNTEVAAVFEDGESEDRPLMILHMKQRTRRGHILHKLTKARVVDSATAALHTEREGGAESPQHLSHLIDDLRFQHSS